MKKCGTKQSGNKILGKNMYINQVGERKYKKYVSVGDKSKGKNPTELNQKIIYFYIQWGDVFKG